MSSPFVAEIRIFGFNFAPRGWAFCDGQLLPISQNTALFSLLGTQYGGDGKSNFALPNLQGAAPIHTSQYAGGGPLGSYYIGQSGGEPYVTLLTSEMPAHTHTAQSSSSAGDQSSPANNSWAGGGRGRPAAYVNTDPDTQLSPAAIGVAGGSQPHNNLPPYLVLNFCIAMQGIFPPRP